MTDGVLATEGDDLAPDHKILEWVQRFSVYRHGPTRNVLLSWLARFERQHLPIAHKLLDAVVIISEIDIHKGYRQMLSTLPGWSKIGRERRGRWFFVGVGGEGESGAAMLRLFREANGLLSSNWQKFFVSARELPSFKLTATDHVVFIDDFAGTGKQITSFWPIIEELVASEAKCFLLLTAVTTAARDKIVTETDLDLKVTMVLDESKNVFSSDCELFLNTEHEVLDSYGVIASPRTPRGFGNCGLTLVLSHKTPNNTLPILHANHESWVGPFPRVLLPVGS